MRVKNIVSFGLAVILSTGVLVSSTSDTIVAKANTSYTIDNDGQKRDNPYGDSKLPSSFKGCEYYDVYVPYAVQLKDIGGWATSGSGAMSEDAKLYNVGNQVVWENDMFNSHYSHLAHGYWTQWSGDVGTTGYESDTQLATITDSNGTVYYISATQHFFWNNDNSFYNWGIAGDRRFDSSAQIFDVILTDGTVIHFTMGDANADNHTNGGTSDVHADGYGYGKESTVMGQNTQYRNMFHAFSGNCIEIWGKDGSPQKFKDKYGLGPTGENHIAYYRIYNAKIDDPPQPANDTVKAVSYNIGVSGISSGGNTGTNGIKFSGRLWDESEFVDMSALIEGGIALPTFDGLVSKEQMAVRQWGSDIEALKEFNKYTFLRGVLMFIGIVLILYSVFLYIAFQFDVNVTFFECQLVKIMTGGKLVVSPDLQTSTYGTGIHNDVKGVVHRDMIFITLTGIAIGVFIISGKAYLLISWIIRWVKLKF